MEICPPNTQAAADSDGRKSRQRLVDSTLLTRLICLQGRGGKRNRRMNVRYWSDLARGDRYRSGWETSPGSGRTENTNETWPYSDNSTIMSATSGTNTAPNQATEGISIAQRMVSATCGSILTSCLGEWLPGFQRCLDPSQVGDMDANRCDYSDSSRCCSCSLTIPIYYQNP